METPEQQLAGLSPEQRRLVVRWLRQEQTAAVAVPHPSLIPRRSTTEPPPLSFAQQRFWFLQQLEPQSPAYNIRTILRLAGPLDLVLLARSLNIIMRRHEALRTTFRSLDGQLRQVIAPPTPLPLALLALDELPPPAQDALVRQLARAAAAQPFDLQEGPLLRVRLLRLTHDAHVLLLTMHHTIADGWSQGVLLRELTTLYAAFLAGRPAALPELPIQYADYACWQRAWLEGSGVRGQGPGIRGQGSDVDERATQNSKLKTQNLSPSPIPHPPSPVEAQLAYWKQQLADAPPALELPGDRPRPSHPTSRGAVAYAAFPATLRDQLIALSRREGATLFMMLLAAFAVLLYRYSGQEDIVVGSPTAGRNRAELEELIGVFVNTLALRIRLEGKLPFGELLRRVRTVCLGAYAHQELPFEQLLETLHLARDLSRHVLFQVMLVLQNVPMPALSGAGLRLEPLEIETSSAVLDLALYFREGKQELQLRVEYSSELFDASTIERLLSHLRILLTAVVAAPEQRLGALPLLSTAEQQQLLEWNATAVAYPQEQGIASLFEAQVAYRPEAVALVFERGQESGVWGLRPARQGDKETRRQGDRRQETEFIAPNPQSPIPNPQSAVLSPQSLTYTELNERANRLAHHLRALGVGAEVRVGIALARSPEAVVAMLAVLKAGGAYVPLDLSYPKERLAFMLEDSQAAVLITAIDQQPPSVPPPAGGLRGAWGQGDKETESAHDVTLSPPHLVTLSGTWPAIAANPPSNPPSTTRPDNAAYLIYTSGSTGRPKAVIGLLRGLLNRVAWMQQLFPFGESEVACHKTALSFVDSVYELFGPLLHGTRLVLLADALLKDPPQLLEALARERVTRMVLVPALLELLLRLYPDLAQRLPALPLWVVSGEALSVDLVERFRAQLPERRLLNLYGSSEVAADVSWYDTAEWAGRPAPIAIGRPLANTQLYVLDAQLQMVPVGVVGELYVGGAGLARGYLHRPDLTAERFIPNPFGWVLGNGCWVLEDSTPITQHPSPNTRLYRTGDLARYWADGVIEYRGRQDRQVKLRGMRIELGEVEATLRQHGAVRAAVVLAREDGRGERRLAAYVVEGSGVGGLGSGRQEDKETRRQGDGEPRASDPQSPIPNPQSLISELRTFLKERLPEHMVPADFVLLPDLPLNPNGKIDWSALPAPGGDQPALEAAFVAPGTPVEQILAEIWANLLGLERVGVHDNFFELGGHSLLAAQMLARVRDAFRVELPLRALFEAPTLAALAAWVERARGMPADLDTPALRPVERDASAPLSYGQERMWLLDQLDHDRAAFNLPMAIQLIGPLDLPALQRSFAEIVRRHETLRTTFAMRPGRLVQIVAPASPLPLPLLDLRSLPPSEREATAQRLAVEQAQEPFDLARDRLARATLLRLDAGEHRLLLTMHHIVSDGWSFGVLFRELAALYDAFSNRRPAPLPELPIQYADFAVWQRQVLREEVLDARLAYWKRRLANLPPSFGPKAATGSMPAARQRFRLPPRLSESLRGLSRKQGVSLFVTLLTALKLVLARHTGCDDVVVGVSSANRDWIETKGLIGFFANMLVLRTDLSDHPSFKEARRRVQEVYLEAYEHRDLPIEKLLEALPHEHIEVVFNFMADATRPIEVAKLHDLAARPVEVEVERMYQFANLVLVIRDGVEGLHGSLTYKADLFDAGTIQRFADSYLETLEALGGEADE